jgi:hypothetical protein
MSKRTKIILLVIGLVVVNLVGYYFINKHVSEKRYIRKNYFSPESKKDVDALEKALKIMREKDCNDPLSWYYQGAIHWIPDTITNNPLCSSYHTFEDKKVAWDNCTHSPSGKEKLHFLVWHRMYIYHFEKIVRKLSGHEEFALPYWAYTNNKLSDKFLHPKFRDPSSSLYEQARFDSLNNGEPISGEIERALDLTKLMSYTSLQMFSNNINAAPHGAMHDYIGHGNDPEGKRFFNQITNSYSEEGLMGWVPTAGFDPIFWMHHSNIDRIWQQWTNSDNGVEFTVEDLKSIPWEYTFFDENGKKVTYDIEDVIKVLYRMDYDFDDTKVQRKRNKNQLVRSVNQKVVGESSPKLLFNNQQTTNVLIKTPNLLRVSKNKSKVTIKISFSKRPKGVYEIYVNPGFNEILKPSNLSFVGFMTFFGADHEMKGKDCGGSCCKETTKDGRTLQTFEFETYSYTDYNFVFYKHHEKHSGDLVIESVQIHR